MRTYKDLAKEVLDVCRKISLNDERKYFKLEMLTDGIVNESWKLNERNTNEDFQLRYAYNSLEEMIPVFEKTLKRFCKRNDCLDLYEIYTEEKNLLNKGE